MKRIKLSLAALCACLFMSSSAFAVVISNPIDYTTSNLVGTADPGTASATIAQETAWANQILALGAGVTTSIGSVDYRTHDTDDYSAILDSADGSKTDGGSNSVEAGFDYVMGKYDGQNAGYVLFYLGGEASTIPESSDSIWLNTSYEGYQLSHWTGWRSTTEKVPEPSALMLLGLGLLGFTVLRRPRPATR